MKEQFAVAGNLVKPIKGQTYGIIGVIQSVTGSTATVMLSKNDEVKDFDIEELQYIPTSTTFIDEVKTQNA